MSLSRAPARDTSETPSPRERIRSHMKMVIDQLDGILKELKDVAKELREVRFKISLHISGFWGFSKEQRGRMRQRQGENVVSRWVCVSRKLHLIKCKILFTAWRFWLRFESDEISLFCFCSRRILLITAAMRLSSFCNQTVCNTNVLHVFSGVLWEVQ